MSGADFSDFLKAVGGIPSFKSLDDIAWQEEPPSKSPTSINTLIPQDDIVKPPADVPETLHGDSASNSGPAAPPSPADDTEATDAVNMTHESPSRGRAASESQVSPSHGTPKRERLDSNASLNIPPSTTQITITSPTENSVQSSATNEAYDLVQRLREVLSDATARGSQQLRFEKVFVETILMSLEQSHKEYTELKEKYDRTKVHYISTDLLGMLDDLTLWQQRASEQYIDGLTVAQKEYDRELVARRNAESEIIRLRVLLSGQAAKLTALTGETSRREARRQMTEELSKNLDQLEKDLSKLKAEREVTLAEVEELCSSKRYAPHLHLPSHSLFTGIQHSRQCTHRTSLSRTAQSFIDDAAGQYQEAVSSRTHTTLSAARDSHQRDR